MRRQMTRSHAYRQVNYALDHLQIFYFATGNLHCEPKKTHQKVFLIYSLQNLINYDTIWYTLS